MQLLLESPIAVASIGLVFVAVAAIAFVQTRSRLAAAGLGLAVLLTIGAVAAERAWRTPRERVLGTVSDLFAAIEANDLPGVLRRIDPTAVDMRSDAEVLMPRFRVESAGKGGEVRVEVAADGRSATAELKPLIKVQHTKTGATGAYFDRLRLDLVRRDEDWLLSDYEPAQDWRDGAARLGRP